MLANLLAVIVGAGSLAFYLTAFVLPEVHRRSDFLWSGVGLFYAVVLWYCSGQMGGAVLLGQTASVGLLVWLGYQTLLLRRRTTPAVQQTPIQFGKSDRNRANGNSPRPIANDYEFVEDGVKDAVDADPDPDSPILIKPGADEFAVRMVVPAAMPPPKEEAEDMAESAAQAPGDSAELAPKPVKIKTKKRPNPLAAVGIVTGWLKDVVTPKKKAPTPMIELPPRPPSIPNAKASAAPGAAVPSAGAETAAIPENSSRPETASEPVSEPASEPVSEPVSEPAEISGTSEVPLVVSGKEEVAGQEELAAKEELAIASPPLTPDPDDEDSNWPEDEFWD